MTVRNWVATKMFLEQNANFNTFEVHPDLPSIPSEKKGAGAV